MEEKLKQTKANATRVRGLSGTGAISTKEIEDALFEEELVTATLAAEKSALEVIQIRMSHTSIVAPDSGVIVTRNATIGTVVSTGTDLFHMVRQNRLEWHAELSPA